MIYAIFLGSPLFSESNELITVFLSRYLQELLSPFFVVKYMSNHYSHITKEHLIFLDITGEERARMIIHEIGTRRISLSPIKEYLNQKEIAIALKSEMTIKQIAKKVGVHPSTVYRYLKRKRNK